MTLGELKLRKGRRFLYEYDLNIPWEHEFRLEERQPVTPGAHYPACMGGDGACPQEDCCRFALNPKNPSQQFQKDSLALNLRIGT
ncbi:hypothetical protein J2046_005526 [Rhizobium petrolearium]|uniref:Plasmid pRiA4b Orf3-like domain-containing protein n=2 Tax=Neorhizobium TaxID=1525371 RepID=A0ABV0MAM3_9HYPH|nr:hypothetical protein [Neorhizobium petrolearium]MBP1847242.1 hypothetical protein [Neorhizobium petrolearium]MCC2614289.1 plasmid pRiA4b ORF-3 family protein [Neorhizobium petrolearium]WGI72393.1 hypothetical protein QEO92_31260 [Neorhizobium petrolearium]